MQETDSFFVHVKLFERVLQQSERHIDNKNTEVEEAYIFVIPLTYFFSFLEPVGGGGIFIHRNKFHTSVANGSGPILIN